MTSPSQQQPPKTNSGSAAEPSIQNAAGLYGRESVHDLFGIKMQHQAGRARAEADGFIVPPGPDFVHEDDDTTGVTASRTGLDRLEELVTSGQAPFSRLYVKDKTRLGRFDDPRYHHYLEVLFQKHGVTICYTDKTETQAELANPDNPNRFGSYLQDAVGSIVASEERRRLIRRVTGGMRDRVRHGFFPGAQAPYGTERWLASRSTGQLVEMVPPLRRLRDPECFFRLRWAEDESRSVIQRIFREIEAGKSMRRIAHDMNRDGIASPGARRGIPNPAPWTLQAVRRIARNPIYCGMLVWGRTTRADFGDALDVADSTADGKPAIRHEDFVVGEAPIALEQWEAVQRVLRGNSALAAQRHAARPEYLLTGLVTCEECGGAFHGHSGTGRRYYRHTWRGANGVAACPHVNRYIAAEPLEEAAIAQLRAMLSDDRLTAAVMEELERRRADSSSERLAERARDLERQLARHRAALRVAADQTSYAETEAEREGFRATRQHVAGLVESCQRELRELNEESDRVTRAEARIAKLARWTPARLEEALCAAPELRRQAIGQILHGVAVAPATAEAQLILRPAV